VKFIHPAAWTVPACLALMFYYDKFPRLMPCTGKFKSSQDIILMQDTDANHKPDAGFPRAKGLGFWNYLLQTIKACS
jgi:hypothetical protein